MGYVMQSIDPCDTNFMKGQQTKEINFLLLALLRNMTVTDNYGCNYDYMIAPVCVNVCINK